MPRNNTSAVNNQAQARIIRPFLMVSMMFSTPVYVWSGLGKITWNGHEWLGLGTLGKISTITEGSAVEAQGITLSVSGVPTDLLTDSLGDIGTRSPAKVYLGLMDESGSVIPDPIPLYFGFMDEPKIKIGVETSEIVIAVENQLSHLNRSRGGRYTDQDQRSRYPNDESLSWVSRNQDIHLLWK